jgi:hypothetical protein
VLPIFTKNELGKSISAKCERIWNEEIEKQKRGLIAKSTFALYFFEWGLPVLKTSGNVIKRCAYIVDLRVYSPDARSDIGSERERNPSQNGFRFCTQAALFGRTKIRGLSKAPDSGFLRSLPQFAPRCADFCRLID